MANPTVLVIALAIVAFIFKLLWTGQTSSTSKLPGTWHSKYTNIVIRFHILSGRRIFYVDDLHRKYGGVVRIAPGEVAVADLAGVSQIHKIGSGFLKSKFYPNLTPMREPGIFSMQDPHAHGIRRKLFARAFSHSNLKSNWETEIRKKAVLAVQKIKGNALGAQEGADVFKWWTLMATDVIAHLSFGESFNMLELGKQTPYIDALQAALLSRVIRSEIPIVHAILRYMPIRRARMIATSDDVVLEHGALAIRNLRSVDGNTMNLFGQMLAASESEEKADMSDKVIQEEAGNFIIAGSDTTAVTLTYLVWAVLKQPELQAKLEEEIGQLSDDFSMAELEVAPILNSVIEETLRLYGAAPGHLPRTVPMQGMTVNGFHIPGGVEVSTQAYTNHRDASVFPNPLSFEGLRFLNKSTLSAQQKAAYMPFGGGSRVCLGIHLALIELRLAAALFFRHCRGARLGPSMTDKMMEMDNKFLISPKGHCCWITLKK